MGDVKAKAITEKTHTFDGINYILDAVDINLVYI